MNIDKELTAVFRDIFADPGLEITDDSSAEDIPLWDSTMHVVLIFAIEDRFDFKFTSEELEKLLTIKDIKAAISSHSCV